MKPADFVAVRRISNKENATLAAAGESCDRVPADALSWLLEGGDIKPKTKAPRAPKPEQPVEGEE